MEEDEVAQTNFMPCVTFVPRGVAKANPEKITLTQEELARIINNTRQDLSAVLRLENRQADGDDDSDEDGDMDTERPDEANSSAPLNFDLENYDNDNQGPEMALADVVDPNELLEDDEDSEEEDDVIKTTDNLILCGHVQEDCSNMEVYIYNESEESLYVHHDFLLPAFPLCIEWLNHDPGNSERANMCAIGSMDPVITVWDLDIQDSLEPIYKLGKRKKKDFGHTDAVLDLSWNKNFSHILASASVDQTVILWDLDSGEPSTKITAFEEKVQSISFQPVEAKTLLTGSCDGYCKLFDCYDLEGLNTSYKKWKLDGEIEKICWNYGDLNYFLAGTGTGDVHMIDIRNESEPIWTQKCHEEEISGLNVSQHVHNMLVTTSADGMLKVWDFNSTECKLTYTQAMKIGRVLCLASSPDSPFTVAIGGDFPKKNFKMVELNHETVQQAFGKRGRINLLGDVNDAEME